MTPDSPDEALHFRGKTLTPESPRPLHVAEPANIPVLQNQMDPVFNDTSTYEPVEYLHGENYRTHPSGHYTWSAEAREDASSGSVQVAQEQRPSQHQSHTKDLNSLLAQSIPGALPSSSHAARNFPFANEVDHSSALQTESVSQGQLDAEGDHSAGNGVDFQNLLDNLPSTSTAPSTSTLAADDAAASPHTDEISQSSMGLPPRPPPQEKPSIHPNYNPTDDIRSYHQLPAQATAATANPYASQPSNYQASIGLASLTGTGAPGTSSGTGSLPPPPVASFQQSSAPLVESQETTVSATQNNARVDKQANRGDEDTPWGPEVQKKYDAFLHDERVYVTEGLWDRFPYGSRLFVGNLPTERVTKRDLFHIFHSYGKLAQISIKQAYGFIQFLESASCKRALEGEQGAIVRGRKVHLEISKPQRNTRPAPAAAEPSRAPPRRSRSPEFSRGGPSSNRSSRAPPDRYDRPHEPGRLPFSDFRDEPLHRRRDDYRPPVRSPSPRGYRPREGYRSRDRTPERFDRRERRRSRSPYSRDRRHRSPSPRRATFDDADLPVARRAPRDVPDVQILVLEELDRNFVYHVEGSFRNRGLRVDILTLGPRIPLDAAVKRQASEGVLAVVRLSRPSQFSRKIPLQVFDRSAGADNIRSNEYPDLEPNVAAEIVFQAQSLQRNAPVPFAPTAFGVPALPTATLPHPAPALPSPPNFANAISHLDGAGLQSLLAALQQQQRPAVPAAQPPFPAPTNSHPTPDLASLLSAATRPPVPLHPPQQLPQQPFPLHTPNSAAISDPNLLSLLAKGLGGPQPQGQAPLPPQQVQNLMSQLGKWRQ